MMNLDDFANYRVSAGDRNELYLRHINCENRYVERIELLGPLPETNLKWLMVKATAHHQEVHQNEPASREKS